MTTFERKATLSLALIFALRMFGLFMVIPLFSLYANSFKDAAPLLLGLAMGIYGLTQALLQLPFGMWSDSLGRKPIIALGLVIFAVGSLIAAFSSSMINLIVGRALQGAGAIGSATTALVADLTSAQERTKAMAIIGITIGASFSLAMVLGPVLHLWLSVPHLFLLSTGLAVIAIFILLTQVPSPSKSLQTYSTHTSIHRIKTLIGDNKLMRLNIGVFILHAIFTASFVVIPIVLKNNLHFPETQQWHVYLPTLFIGSISALYLVNLAEKKEWIHPIFISGIIMLIVSEFLFLIFSQYFLSYAFSLILFFTGFTFLEANLPSLVSKIAPAHSKGTAMGIYSTHQFLGIFFGGALGGWLLGHYAAGYVFLFCGGSALVWLIITNKINYDL